MEEVLAPILACKSQRANRTPRLVVCCSYRGRGNAFGRVVSCVNLLCNDMAMFYGFSDKVMSNFVLS